MNVVELKGVTKRYGATVALRDVTLSIPARSIVGLIGRNGSGKSTLLRHISGLVLPDAGDCTTLGVPSARLDRDELARMGVVDQHATLLEWMRVDQLLAYVARFYATWDGALERELINALDIDVNARVGTLSPGNVQRVAVVLATCHHPALLLLDEPLSDLDPIARQSLLAALLDRFSSDDMTIVISSHMLRDIEPVVDRIICMDRGSVVADDELDALRERHAEWIVTSPAGRLPSHYDEAFVLRAQGDAQRARLLVRDGALHLATFASRYDASIEARPLNLEQIFPLLTTERAAHAEYAQ